MKRRWISILILMSVLVNASFISFSIEEKSFLCSRWAERSINEAYDRNLIHASLDHDLTVNITREEFCELVIHYFERESAHVFPAKLSAPFRDTSNEAVIKAYSLGIISGYSKYVFAPDESITREQIAVMLRNTLTALSLNDDRYNLSDRNLDLILFNDEMDISRWALKDVKLLYKNRLMSGIGNHTIAPKNTATREQAITLINNVYTKIHEMEAKASAKDTVQTISSGDTDAFIQSVIEVQDVGNNTLVFKGINIPDAVGSLNVGDVYVAQGRDKQHQPFIGKVKSKSIEANGSYMIAIEEPMLDEVFNSIDININGEVDEREIVDFSFIGNTSVMVGNRKIFKGKDGGLYSLSPQSMVASSSKVTAPSAIKLDTSNGNLVAVIKETPIFDVDGDLQTTNDQINISGKIGITDIQFDTKIKKEKDKDIEQMRFKASCKKIAEAQIQISCEDAHVNIGELLNSKQRSDGSVEVENPNAVVRSLNDAKGDFATLRLEGVDLSDRVVLGEVTYEIGSLPGNFMSESITSPIEIVVLFTWTFDAGVQGSATLNYKHTTFSEYGIDFHKKTVAVPEGSKTYDLGEYELEMYSPTESNKMTENTFRVGGDISKSLQSTLGPEMGLRTFGIVPVLARGHLMIEGEETLRGSIEYNNSDISVEGIAIGKVGIGILTGFYLRTMASVELDKWFIKFSAENGYAWEWEDVFPIWYYEESNIYAKPLQWFEYAIDDQYFVGAAGSEAKALASGTPIVPRTVGTGQVYATGSMNLLFEDRNGLSQLVRIEVSDDTHNGPRGIRVGDRISRAIGSTNNNDGALYIIDGSGGSQVIRLQSELDTSYQSVLNNGLEWDINKNESNVKLYTTGREDGNVRKLTLDVAGSKIVKITLAQESSENVVGLSKLKSLSGEDLMLDGLDWLMTADEVVKLLGKPEREETRLNEYISGSSKMMTYDDGDLVLEFTNIVTEKGMSITSDYQFDHFGEDFFLVGFTCRGTSSRGTKSGIDLKTKFENDLHIKSDKYNQYVVLDQNNEAFDTRDEIYLYNSGQIELSIKVDGVEFTYSDEPGESNVITSRIPIGQRYNWMNDSNLDYSLIGWQSAVYGSNPALWSPFESNELVVEEYPWLSLEEDMLEKLHDVEEVGTFTRNTTLLKKIKSGNKIFGFTSIRLENGYSPYYLTEMSIRESGVVGPRSLSVGEKLDMVDGIYVASVSAYDYEEEELQMSERSGNLYVTTPERQFEIYTGKEEGQSGRIITRYDLKLIFPEDRIRQLDN